MKTIQLTALFPQKASFFLFKLYFFTSDSEPFYMVSTIGVSYIVRYLFIPFIQLSIEAFTIFLLTWKCTFQWH